MHDAHLIDSFDIDRNVFVIAEIGNNHEGDVALAEEMVGLAAQAGAHAVKFQSIRPDELVSPQQTDRIEQLSRYQLSSEDHQRLADLAKQEGVTFLSTPFYLDAIEMLNPLVPAFKIASGDNNFQPLLEKVAESGKPILLSCGIADQNDVSAAQRVILNKWQENDICSFLVLMHCVSSYPTAPADADLAAIKRLQEIADLVGYSDHTLGVDAAVIAAGLGACVIEKHFTIDKNYSAFRDHQLSADPRELKELCERVALASEMVQPSGSLRDSGSNEHAARRSIAARRDLPAGRVIGRDDITWLRPGGGFAPDEEDAVLGRTLERAVRAGDMFRPADLGK